MTGHAFSFLETLGDEAVRSFLRAYLADRPTAPAIAVPQDSDRVVRLAESLAADTRAPLRARVRDALREILSRAVESGRYRQDAEEALVVGRCLYVAELLPEPEPLSKRGTALYELLLRLGAVGLLQGVEADGEDLHRRVLRALALQQRPLPNQDWPAFWRTFLSDPRYCLAAWHGLRRASLVEALRSLPVVYATARRAEPPVPTVFLSDALAQLLGPVEVSSRTLAEALAGDAEALERLKEDLRELGRRELLAALEAVGGA